MPDLYGSLMGEIRILGWYGIRLKLVNDLLKVELNEKYIARSGSQEHKVVYTRKTGKMRVLCVFIVGQLASAKI